MPDTNAKEIQRTSEGLLKGPESVEHAPVWLAKAIEWARDRRATDLHFFPSETEAMLWVRVDGDLREVARYSLAIHQRMMARMKVLGRCADYTGELVQEGRFSLNGHSASGEARFSILPTLRGEKAVVRLLTATEGLKLLPNLGFSDPLNAALREAVLKPQGLILAVGPSGCGKSTALYALLSDLHQRAGRPISTVTIEDPIERSLPFAAQISADPARGLGFAQCLRAILRQDPEVILIGEIRDAETATAALQAALTGHRLLSTMHTLSAAEALVRLQQMGSAPYVISSALAGVLNLRLVRLLCPECRTTRPVTDLERAELSQLWDAAAGIGKVAEAPGCNACLGSGYLGRSAVGEWLVPTPETTSALQAALPTSGIAPTLRAVVAAQPAALGLLAEGKISHGEFQNLTGLDSISQGPEETK